MADSDEKVARDTAVDDYYEFFGIPRNADSETIEDAWQRLSTGKTAKDGLNDLRQAYETLIDTNRREKYDELLKEQEAMEGVKEEVREVNKLLEGESDKVSYEGTQVAAGGPDGRPPLERRPLEEVMAEAEVEETRRSQGPRGEDSPPILGTLGGGIPGDSGDQPTEGQYNYEEDPEARGDLELPNEAQLTEVGEADGVSPEPLDAPPDAESTRRRFDVVRSIIAGARGALRRGPKTGEGSLGTSDAEAEEDPTLAVAPEEPGGDAGAEGDSVDPPDIAAPADTETTAGEKPPSWRSRAAAKALAPARRRTERNQATAAQDKLKAERDAELLKSLQASGESAREIADGLKAERRTLGLDEREAVVTLRERDHEEIIEGLQEQRLKELANQDDPDKTIAEWDRKFQESQGGPEEESQRTRRETGTPERSSKWKIWQKKEVPERYWEQERKDEARQREAAKTTADKEPEAEGQATNELNPPEAGSGEALG